MKQDGHGAPCAEANAANHREVVPESLAFRRGEEVKIRHKTLDKWLLPGGHIEPEDSSLLGASLRELEEEAGIPLGNRQSLPPLMT